MPNFDVRDAYGSVITIESSVVGGANRQIVTTALGNSSVMLLNSSAVIGSVTVLQGTNPWVMGSISGTTGSSIVGQLPAGTAVLGSVATLQGTNPWIISSIYGNISGSVASFPRGTIITSLVSTIPSSVIVGASIFGHAPVFIIVGSVATLQGTNPWTVDGEVTVGNFPTNQNISGSVVAFQGGTVITSIIGAMADTA